MNTLYLIIYQQYTGIEKYFDLRYTFALLLPRSKLVVDKTGKYIYIFMIVIKLYHAYDGRKLSRIL